MKKKTKKNLLILMSILLLIVIGFVLRYFLYIRPLKQQLINKSLEYIDLKINVHVLPDKYNGKTSLTNEEKAQIENDMKLKQSKYLKTDTSYFNEQQQTNMVLIQDQLEGKLIIEIPNKIIDYKIVETKIKSNTAIVRINVTKSRGIVYENVPMYNDLSTQYNLEYKKVDNKWLIINGDSRPIL